MSRIRAFAPASVGNAGVGFDLLGFALDFCGDLVEVAASDPGVRILSISGAKNLPLGAAENTATAGLIKLIGDKRLPFGFDVRISKGIPIGSGLGGSAASAVAGIVAASALLDEPLSQSELIEYALVGEAVASGAAHEDNVIPSLLGGLQICDGKDSQAIPVPEELFVVVVHPSLSVKTMESRLRLPDSIPLTQLVQQSRYLAQFIAAGFGNDAQKFGRACIDLIAEPHRVDFIPGFEIARRRAISAGAWSVSISGSGPTLFAFVPKNLQSQVEKLMVGVFTSQGIDTKSWCTTISQKGARIEDIG